jgi:hypothetical protein
VLSRQCLDRRIADQDFLKREVAAWEGNRNRARVKVDWQFTSADDRIKLKRLYPEDLLCLLIHLRASSRLKIRSLIGIRTRKRLS